MRRRSGSEKEAVVVTLAVATLISLSVSCGGSTVQGPPAGDQDASDDRATPAFPTDSQPVQGDGKRAGDGAPSPRAFILASLAASRDPNGSNLCSFNSARAVLQIGTPLGTDPTRVNDGAVQMGAAVVNVSCVVTGGFDLTLDASLGGAQGGSVSIAGHVDAAAGGHNIQGVLNTPISGGAFVENNCTIAFTYGGGPVPQTPSVAPGRVWAHLSCPAMVNMNGAVVHLMDGTAVQETCDGEVDFLFENCSQ